MICIISSSVWYLLGFNVYICSEPKEERKAVETTPGYSLMVLFNNRGAASPTRPQNVGGNLFPRERT